jgi:hypothetical protein
VAAQFRLEGSGGRIHFETFMREWMAERDDGFASLMTDELSIPGAPLHDHFVGSDTDENRWMGES